MSVWKFNRFCLPLVPGVGFAAQPAGRMARLAAPAISLYEDAMFLVLGISALSRITGPVA